MPPGLGRFDPQRPLAADAVLWLSHPGGPDRTEMQAILASLPLDAWMPLRATPLTPCPGEPVLAAS